MGWRAQPVRTRRAGVDHTNQPTMSVCSPGILPRTGLYRISRYTLALDDAMKSPVQAASPGRLTGPRLAVFHFAYPTQDGLKPDLIRGKHALYQLYRFFAGTLCVCVCAHARIEVRRYRYNRYKLPLYPPTSLKNQGSRAYGAYRFSKIAAQKWYTTHTSTSPRKRV